ncbi:MAG TPA: alpha/beta hydrolase domain-containing protein [Bryobacteraceae bacterium]|nr:alpha/beta hydrolase domain-containing protein [Bryobacteraceae bacterium]
MKQAFLAGLATAAFLTAPLDARITRIVIEHKESPAYEGQSFGEGGRYERLSGRAYGELDPKDPLNAIITDIQLAPRNVHGMVEYSATFLLVKPVDMARASGLLLYEVPNRGNSALVRGANNPGAIADYFRRGHVVLASGWQGDIPAHDGIETITVPIARNPDGSSITGRVLARFFDMPANSSTLPIVSGGTPRPLAASLDNTKATLTRKASEGTEITPIKSADWAFADCSSVAFPGTPDPSKICLKGGFNPAFLYELTYTAKDPLVLGIGFAATRDLNAYFRYTDSEQLAHKISRAIAWGNSQSGNFLRTMVHLGFNQDESGKIVWDGINSNIAVRQLAMNYRFAAPGGAAGLYEPGSDGVVWWTDYTDEVRHRPMGGLLDRCHASETCPKVFETFGASEFWNLRGSPDLVGTRADRDIPLPPNVRRYYFPGVTHGGGAGGFSTTAPKPPARCELPANPNPSSDTMRALMVALVDWVVKGTAPPPSQYPHLDQKQLTLPTQAAMKFPVIPGQPLPDGILNSLYDYDYGSSFNYNDLSGTISMQPPVIKQMLPSLAPTVDADGNETSGVASVLHQAPLGTYVGWNVTASGFLKGQGCGNLGGYIPFAKTKAERLAAGDPRPSIEERYASHEAYVAQVRTAAERLVRERFLLQDDADRLIAAADSSNVLK